MLKNVPLAVSELDHCHVVPLMLPSASVRVAVMGMPRSGWVVDRATVPARSAWAAAAETTMSNSSLTDPPLPSLAVTFTVTVPTSPNAGVPESSTVEALNAQP